MSLTPREMEILRLIATGQSEKDIAADLGIGYQTVKNAAGQLGMLYCYNPAAAVTYVQLFDTTGSPTLGTTAPSEIYGIPTVQSGGLAMTPIGIQYSNAIKIAATTTATALEVSYVAAAGTTTCTFQDCYLEVLP
mgnify:CR=1 FL=1